MVQLINIIQNMNVINMILWVFSNGHSNAKDYLRFIQIIRFFTGPNRNDQKRKPNFFERGGKAQRFNQIREIV